MTKDLIEDKKVKYNQVIEQIGRYRITHLIPILNEEEKKQKYTEIITKMIRDFSNHKN